MKYAGMPFGMWLLFKNSFEKHLVPDLGYTSERAETITEAAKRKYREIISGLPEFEKGDRFQMNIVAARCFPLLCFPWTDVLQPKN